MRWFKAECGDVRIVKRFALFPMKINQEVRWLETCYILQKYVDVYDVFLCEYFSKWSNEKFVTKEEYERNL